MHCKCVRTCIWNEEVLCVLLLHEDTRGHARGLPITVVKAPISPFRVILPAAPRARTTPALAGGGGVAFLQCPVP